MVCDKVVCVKDGVCACDTEVCERWCVTKEEEEEEAEEAAEEAGGTDPKREPHTMMWGINQRTN